MKKILYVLFLVGIFLISGCGADTPKSADKTTQTDSQVAFVDDDGNEIVVTKPAERIISLYSAHTENMCSLGLQDKIIGIGKADAYPPEILEKTVYDYRSDPEKLIAAEPDLVIIRPFVRRSAPDFIAAVENAGINVVSLYPDSFDEFDDYIEKLAILTGREIEAQALLEKFHKDINEVVEISKNIPEKVNVYFESTQTEYRTITDNSMAGRAIKFAGGINIAKDAVAIKEGSSIASYGAERILEKAEDIDVFIAQRGAMNSGGNPRAIRQRAGFKAIKAVANDRIYNINEKYSSSPTFRYSKGVHEIARMLYPDVFDSLEQYKTDEELTRATAVEIVVKYMHRPFFSPTSRYYSSNHRGHVYGTFADVDSNHPRFDYIETGVMSGKFNYFGEEFRPDQKYTRAELANTLNLLLDLPVGESKAKDIENSKFKSAINIVVHNGIMSLDNGNFNPDKTITGLELVNLLEKIDNLKK